MNKRKIAAIMAAESRSWPHTLAPMPREEWPAAKPGVPYPVEVYRSRHFLVQVFKEESGFRLSVNRTELMGWIGNHPLWRDGITWEDLQRLKAEAGYALCWAVECYPPDDAVVNVANMRHLWLLAESPAYGWHRNAHDWFEFRPGLICCRRCSIVKRADGANRPCKGQAFLRPLESVRPLAPEEESSADSRDGCGSPSPGA